MVLKFPHTHWLVFTMINVNKMLASLGCSGMMKGSGNYSLGGTSLGGGAMLGVGIAGGVAVRLLNSKNG
jgi:hypothetical protein